MLDDTIAAIATPLGEGGLAVIRISGRDALAVADRCFVAQSRGAHPLAAAPSHTMCGVTLCMPSGIAFTFDISCSSIVVFLRSRT